MARQELTKITSPGGYSNTGTALTFTAQIADGSMFRATGRELVLVKNPDSSDHTVTVQSVEDRYNRTEDISSYNVPAGETHIFGVFPLHGWQQSDGNIYIDGETSLELAIITLK